LSERNIIFIEAFANHLLAGTTHLEDKTCVHKMDVLTMERDSLIQGMSAFVSPHWYYRHWVSTTDTGSVLPMGVDSGHNPLNPGDLPNQKLRNHWYEF
jgi:hypothetical protein